MLKVMFLLLSLFLSSAAFGQQAYDATTPPSQPAVSTQLVSAGTSTQFDRVTVQRVNTYKYWRPGDQKVIDAYLARYRGKLDKGNHDNLVGMLPQLVGSGQLDARDKYDNLILDQRPVELIRMGQGYCGVISGTDWYVDILRSAELPQFTCGGTREPLVLDDIPVLTAMPCVYASPGAMRIFHPGDRQENPIGSAWKLWIKVPQTCLSGETCNDVGSPKPPNKPPAQGQPTPVDHGTGGAPWDPTLTNPHIADTAN